MKSRLPLFAVQAALMLTGCQVTTTELSVGQKTEIAEAVRQAHADYWNTWARMEDFDEYAAYYSDQYDRFPLIGFESLEAHRSGVVELWGGLRIWEIQRMEFDVRVLGPDDAFLAGYAVSLLTDTTGASEVWEQDYAYVWVREDAGWKLGAASSFTDVIEP